MSESTKLEKGVTRRDALLAAGGIAAGAAFMSVGAPAQAQTTTGAA